MHIRVMFYELYFVRASNIICLKITAEMQTAYLRLAELLVSQYNPN